MTIKTLALILAAAGGAAALAMAPRAGSPAEGPASSTVQPVAAPIPADSYPFYMPMQGLKRPANKFLVKCEASRRAGREVYAGASPQSVGGRVEGGYEIVYEASDAAGQPCVYPFSPAMPQVVGALHNTQYILRSSVPGRQVTFRTRDEWGSIGVRLLDFGRQRVHFEMRDIAVDFPAAVRPRARFISKPLAVRRRGCSAR